MADLRTDFAGIKSPNPFWLASAPPTDKYYNVERAFKAGWGGAVWKTLGEPIVNVSSRYGAVQYNGGRVAGFNNIELITDRPLDVNPEIKQLKKEWPTGRWWCADGALDEESRRPSRRGRGHRGRRIELNFGCPHGMSERGMGAAVGQVPEYVEMVTRWCKRTPACR